MAAACASHCAIKEALASLNLLNPGKVFDTHELVSSEPP